MTLRNEGNGKRKQVKTALSVDNEGVLFNHYRLAAFQIDEKHGTSFTLQEVASLLHDLCHKTLQVVLFFKNTSSQVQQNLIAFVLKNAVLKKLRILNTC